MSAVIAEDTPKEGEIESLLYGMTLEELVDAYVKSSTYRQYISTPHFIQHYFQDYTSNTFKDALKKIYFSL